MQRALESRAFISAILAMAIGAFLFYAHPFPEEQIFLRVIAMRAPQAFLSFKYLYYTLLFTTPSLVCLTLLSGLYIFTLKAREHISPGRLPNYPDPSKRDDLFLVVGEVHNPLKPVPAKAPYWRSSESSFHQTSASSSSKTRPRFDCHSKTSSGLKLAGNRTAFRQ